jgi:small subunit ribosomal protein S16
MVRIRLRRTGKRHQPSYRVVVADSESPRDGRFIENIGFYNPRNDPPTIEIDAERARYWLSVGAQPSDPVARLLRKVGVLGGAAVPEAAPAQAAAAEAAVAEPTPEKAVAQEVAPDQVEAEEATPDQVEVEEAAPEVPAESAETEGEAE